MIRRCLFAVVAALYSIPATAFDPGHHLDLTRDALAARGMSQDAIDQVCVANWAVDYYSYSGTAPNSQDELQKLHFDNLYTNAHVESYWRQFTLNLKAAITQASANGNQNDFFALTGIALHTVQDFYAHSNWCEAHPRTSNSSYRTATWYTNGLPAGLVYTGKFKPYPTPPPANTPEHGDYVSGLNKDSHIRPLWDEAYVFAYVASRQTLAAIEQWADAANPGFFAQAAQSSMSSGERQLIKSDLRAAYEVSLWVKNANSGADGHWKGNRSGDTSLFAAAATRFAATPDSAIIHAIKSDHIHEKLSQGLYQGPVNVSPPTFPNAAINERAIVVATTRVRELPASFGSQIDNIGDPDFFCRTRIAGRLYVDRTVQSESSFANPWVTIAFISNSNPTTAVEIEVWDEEDVGNSPERCDIHPANGKKSVSFTANAASDLTGDVIGRFDSPAGPATFTGAGDGNLAEIKLYCVSRTLQ